MRMRHGAGEDTEAVIKRGLLVQEHPPEDSPIKLF